MASNHKKSQNKQFKNKKRNINPVKTDVQPVIPEVKDELQENKMIASIDQFFEKRIKLFFILSLIFTAIFSLYLFDFKIDEGGDDSSYIQAAYNLMKGKSFPSWHGEFYSIVLVLPILLFGINVVLLKFLSFIFMIGHLFFFYKTFKDRINPSLLALTMLVISLSSNILFFSSQTYSEALFMFIQILAFYFLFKLIDIVQENKMNNIGIWKQWVVCGLIIFLLSITRNIGIAIFLSIIIFFLFNKKYYGILYIIGGYYLFSIPFQLYKKIAWKIGESTMSQQLDIILYKNPYNKAQGTEDFSGMVTRFIENTKIYLTRHFFNSIGLREPNDVTPTILPAVILVILFLIALYFAYKKNKYMFLTGIYLGISIFTTFITLAKSWGQLRMIVIYIPFILLFVSWGVFELSKVLKLKFISLVMTGLFIVMIFKNLQVTAEKVKDNKSVLAKNMAGNKYYGFTPDWINFLKMSEWVGKNIPEEKKTASRKPSMSFIYSKGREFYGIFRLPLLATREILSQLDDSSYLIIPYKNLFIEKIPPQIHNFFRINTKYVLNNKNELIGIYQFDASIRKFAEQTLKSNNIVYFETSDAFLNVYNPDAATSYIISPEELLNNLKENDVEYVIKASLRVNPKMKTDRIITTIQNYLFFIEQKYPGIFEKVFQIGENEDEPAQLFRVRYEVYGIEI